MDKKIKKKRKKKSSVRNESLHFRLSKREKNEIKKNAAKLKVSMSDYVRAAILSKGKGNVSSNKLSMSVVLCQDIVTYVQERYACEDDTELEERIDKLWNILC